ncbi:MAG TPA: Lpg1974 family pore-forming outer membrane protein [Rhabdochlamydiaceae bacterium]|jgi:hypothetical protein
MKKYILFSLCTIFPLALQAEKITDVLLKGWDEIDLLEEKVEEELALEEEVESDSERITYQDNAPDMSNPSMNNDGCPFFALPIHHGGEFVDLEFLWWKSDENGLEYAIHKHEGDVIFDAGLPGGIPRDTLVGTWHRVDMEWSPGLRVKAGYRFSNEDLWELDGVYTFYYTDGNDKVKVDATYPGGQSSTLNSAENLKLFIGVPFDENEAYIKASAKANLWYHIGDIELAAQITLTPRARLRFVVGPTMAFIQQKFRITAYNQINALNPAIPTQKVVNDFNWDFSGGGIKIGADSRWDLGWGINLLFGSAFSSIYGVFTNTIKEKAFYTGAPLNPTTSVPTGVLGNTKFSRGKVAFAGRIEGGAGWNHAFCNWNLEVFAKYELNTWFNITDQYRAPVQNPNFDTILSVQSPTLNLQGMTFGVNINF